MKWSLINYIMNKLSFSSIKYFFGKNNKTQYFLIKRKKRFISVYFFQNYNVLPDSKKGRNPLPLPMASTTQLLIVFFILFYFILEMRKMLFYCNNNTNHM